MIIISVIILMAALIVVLSASAFHPSLPLPPSPHHARHTCRSLPHLSLDEDRERKPWYHPRIDPNWVWPPRVDDMSLVLGDVMAVFVAASVLDGSSPTWLSEGSAMACAWLVGAAVTNAWDNTATLPALGLQNAVKCVARASVDYTSTRLCLALGAAVLSRQPVDISLILKEVVLGATTLMLWRTAYTTSRIYF